MESDEPGQPHDRVAPDQHPLPGAEPEGPPAAAPARRSRRALWIGLGSAAALVAAILVVALIVRTPAPARPPVAKALATATTAASTPTAKPAKPVTLTMAYWGDFGMDSATYDYQVVDPSVTFKLVSQDFDDVHKHLQSALDANHGAPDIVAIHEDYLPQFRDQAAKFVDLRGQPGGAARERDYLPWVWQRSLGPQGQQMALGDEATGNAFCYRRDLFQAAGLPTDRAAVEKLWPTWQAFAATAGRYTARTGKPFIDNATDLLQAVLQQQPTGYFSANGALSLSGPQRAWDTVLPLAGPDVSAHLDPDTKPWKAGLTSGRFAVTQCPSWRLSDIHEAVAAAFGKWDVAALPGVAGNAGSDYLAIPKQSRHVAQAWRFINWYTAPEQQARHGGVPVQPAALSSLTYRERDELFFNQAPVGRIYARSVQAMPVQYLPRTSTRVRKEVEGWLWQVETGEVSASRGWREAARAARDTARQKDV